MFNIFSRLSGLALLVCLAACSSIPADFEKPTVTLAGVSVGTISLLEQQFVLNLRVANPNNIDIPLNGLNVSLDVNGKAFANGVSSEATTLPRLGSAIIKLKVSTSLSTFIQQFNALQASGKPIAYRIKGKLFLPLRPDGVSFERQGEVNLP
jgi:LEA14-like dessication related protein